MKKYTKKTIEFYDKHVEKYFESGGVVLENKMNKFIELLQGNKILDVACGPGHDTDYLMKKGFNCLGIDLSKKMIEFAKKRHKGKFRVADFLNLKFKENSFDGIWCSSAFTHIDKSDLSKTLLDFKRISKSNGIFGIIVPENQERKQKKSDSRIFTMFEKEELENYLTESGFKILWSETFSFNKMKWLFVVSKK